MYLVTYTRSTYFYLFFICICCQPDQPKWELKIVFDYNCYFNWYPYTALWCKRWTWFAIRFYFAFWQDKTLWTKFFIWKFVYKCNYQLSIYKVLTTWFFFSYIYIYNTSDEKEWLWIWSHSLFRTLQDLYLLALVVMSDEIWTKRLS